MSDRLRVLIVDDEPTVVRALRRVLRVAHDVDGCTSGDEVVARLRAGERYGVLVIDYRLADRTAASLVDEIAAISLDQALRIVSGEEAVQIRALGRELPAIRKPVATKDLERVVAAVAAE